MDPSTSNTISGYLCPGRKPYYICQFWFKHFRPALQKVVHSNYSVDENYQQPGILSYKTNLKTNSIHILTLHKHLSDIFIFCCQFIIYGYLTLLLSLLFIYLFFLSPLYFVVVAFSFFPT